MVYSRPGRPSKYFEARTRTGWKQICTHTPDKKLAQSMEHMWDVLSSRHRAWDLLDPVLADPKTIGALFDAWTDTKQDVEEMRRRAKDVDVEPLVAVWAAIYTQRVEADSAKHAVKHVRFFFPVDAPRLASSVTSDWLTTRLSEYPAKRRNTRRKVHSSLSVFFDYLVMPKRIYAASPMLHVERPKLQRTLPTFYDTATVERIINWQPTLTRSAFFALVYGTGADVSPALLVDRADINPAAKEVRVAGTKSAARDRIVRVSDAMWPTFWAHAKTILHGRIFPETWDRWTTSDWHRHAVGLGVKNTRGEVERAGLKLPKRLPLRKARHYFATRLLQAGVPVRLVAEQLGSDERTVLKHYGPWITSPEDRARWEKIAAKHEAKSRKAQ